VGRRPRFYFQKFDGVYVTPLNSIYIISDCFMKFEKYRKGQEMVQNCVKSSANQTARVQFSFRVSFDVQIT
jgi:hypothetical protein